MTVELRHEPVHSPFGGSVAARVLQCPASVDLTRKVPAYLRKPSAYADRGTALHSAIALLLAEDAHVGVHFAQKARLGSRHTPVTSRVRDTLARAKTSAVLARCDAVVDERGPKAARGPVVSRLRLRDRPH